MRLALHSLLVYEQIVVHSNLKLMTKLTDYETIPSDSHVSVKEQSDALHRAWISNTEVQLLKRKSQFGRTNRNYTKNFE